MKPVDEETKRYYKVLTKRILSTPFRFTASWIRENDWVVVPVEDEGHFSEAHISNIAELSKSPMFAVATEDIEPLAANCYELASSTEDLHEFNRICGPFFYLLSTVDCSWAVSCNNEYNLFAGDRQFVAAILGESVTKAMARFNAYAERNSCGNPDLLYVGNQYTNQDKG